ncbi:MAG TPA: hypothetical protein VMM36_17365 [Opitutaceae bacterium]|nr:hypothetical protein [Opitutaceae bacterium]
MPSSIKSDVPDVPPPVWRDLLDAAIAFRAQRPWEWLYDSEVFALIDAQGRPWFSSVLGAGKQVYGLVFYRGVAGLRFLMDAKRGDGVPPRDAAIRQDAVMLDWGNKRAMQPEDLDVLRRLGYAPRPKERLGWPCFRDHAPGLFPWFLDSQGAADLTRGLRATIATSGLARADPGFFAPCDTAPDVLPTLDLETAIAGNLRPDQVEWRRWLVPEQDEPPPIVPDPQFTLLAQLPVAKKLNVEFDIVHTLNPVGDRSRPYFPRLALMADRRSGFIYAMDLAEPETPWEDLVRKTWAKALQSVQGRPERLHVRRPEWMKALRPLAEACGVKLHLHESLPAIDEAVESLDRFSSRGR